jgi:hypothetical protein
MLSVSVTRMDEEYPLYIQLHLTHILYLAIAFPWRLERTSLGLINLLWVHFPPVVSNKAHRRSHQQPLALGFPGLRSGGQRLFT